MRRQRIKKQIIDYTILAIGVLIILSIPSFVNNYIDEYEKKGIENILELSNQQMLEDYDYFWEIVNNEIPFMAKALEEKGIDVEELNSSYRQRIISQPSLEEFCKTMFRLEDKTDYIAHLSIITWDDFNKSNLDKSIFDSRGIQTDKFDEVANYIDKKYIKHIRQLPLKALQPSREIEKISDTWWTSMVDEKTAYLNCGSFTKDITDSTKIERFYEKIKNYDNLIIDIRNNTGGYIDVWENYIVSPLTSKELHYENYSCYSLGNLTSAQYYDDKKFSSVSEEELNYLKTLPNYNTTIEMFDGVPYNIVKGEMTIKNEYPQYQFAGNIYLLTNEITYSGADSFTNFCIDTGFATVIGKPTSGNGIYAVQHPQNDMYFQLPNSGFVFQYYPWMGVNSDGSSNAISGDIPNIYTEEDAYSECIKLIKDSKEGDN